jgi:hypothetical protein
VLEHVAVPFDQGAFVHIELYGVTTGHVDVHPELDLVALVEVRVVNVTLSYLPRRNVPAFATVIVLSTEIQHLLAEKQRDTLTAMLIGLQQPLRSLLIELLEISGKVVVYAREEERAFSSRVQPIRLGKE